MSDAPPILVAGEALYDVIAGAGEDPTLSGHAGGGPFNIARTLGRLRQPVAFLGRVSTDRLGMTHTLMLAADGVGLGSVVRSSDPTTLALASLDAEGVARWSFYSADTAAAGLTPEAALAALPPRVAALHVGTLGLVLEPLATAIEALVAPARRRDHGRPGPERPAAGDPRPGRVPRAPGARHRAQPPRQGQRGGRGVARSRLDARPTPRGRCSRAARAPCC